MSEIKRSVHFEDGKVIHLGVQDCEPIIEHNKRMQNEQQTGETFRLVARIPNIIVEQWLCEEWARGNTSLKPAGEEFEKLIDRKLADPDWKWLRTT